MAIEVDARGLVCPQPVILTRKAMAASAEVLTIVDSATSRDNVRRMADKAGRAVRVEEQGAEWRLHISAGSATEVEALPDASATGYQSPMPAGGPLVLVVSDNKMGRGDQALGEILVRGFFHALGEVEPRPEVLVFFNAGVWLAIDDSPVLADSKALEAEGVTILVCGTCLKHFGVTERLAVGTISNMYDIAETMLAAGKVVTL